MKTKKFLCLILSLIMLLMTAIPASAYVLDESFVSLKRKFIDGETLLDYCYYTPVKGEEDNTKYPLVVWLHGNKSGDYKRHQLNNCLISYWASEGAQELFHNGGAFIYLPRHETLGLTVGDLAWDGQTYKLKQCIDEFIKDNKNNIDTTRIYVGGYSMGGKGAFKQLCTFPDFYAAGVLTSPVYSPSIAELEAAKNVPMWVFSCREDNYPALQYGIVNANWNKLCSITAVPEKCRRTTFDKAYYTDGTIKEGESHNSWDPVLSDLFKMGTTEPFDGMHTVNAKGEKIEITYPDGFLSWLNSHSIPEEQAEGSHGVPSFIAWILDFFNKIKNFFRNLF